MATDVYRPLTTLSFAVDYAVWGLNSFGYHLMNIVLHSANAILVCILLLLLSENFFIAFFGSLIFASHPVQTEVVAWISGRSSVLFLFFYLASLIFYIKFTRMKKPSFYYFSIFLFALSLFSKEMSLTLPLIIILYDMHFPSKEGLNKKIIRYMPYFALCLFYVALRITLIKMIGQFEGWGSPYFVFLTMLNVVVDYIRILVYPIKLCAVGYPIPIAVSMKEPRVIFSIVTLFAILASVPILFRKNRPASFALLWFFITLLPVLNIIPIKALEAERFLYLPSIGFCLLAACAASLLDEKLNKPVIGRATIIIALAGILIMGYSLKTVLRAEDWKDEVVISNKTVLASPDSAWALTALGANLMERKNYRAALEPLERAVALNEGYELARNALGECYLRLGRNKEAATQFIEVLKMNP
ncbi:MAG: tetratricopeptide repeat protein, partial [Candidatus Omnitrophica bacterium]|nr:tetratricopeptide repeat protein [Candidatus Omnitrophota bacterium]